MLKTLMKLGLAAAIALPTAAGAETVRMGCSSAPRSIDRVP